MTLIILIYCKLYCSNIKYMRNSRIIFLCVYDMYVDLLYFKTFKHWCLVPKLLTSCFSLEVVWWMMVKLLRSKSLYSHWHVGDGEHCCIPLTVCPSVCLFIRQVSPSACLNYMELWSLNNISRFLEILHYLCTFLF